MWAKSESHIDMSLDWPIAARACQCQRESQTSEAVLADLNLSEMLWFFRHLHSL